MSASTKLCLYLFTLLCILVNGLPAQGRPQDPQEVGEAIFNQMSNAKDKFMSKMPVPTEGPPISEGEMRKRRDVWSVMRLKRQADYDDDNSAIIPQAEYPPRKDFGQQITESFERFAEGLKRMWQNLAKSMEKFVGTIRGGTENEPPRNNELEFQDTYQ